MVEAARASAQQDALLADTRAEISRLLEHESVGLFSSHRLGRYELGALIGRGGMGEVYEARDRDTNNAAALKVLRFDRVSQPSHLLLATR